MPENTKILYLQGQRVDDRLMSTILDQSKIELVKLTDVSVESGNWLSQWTDLRFVIFGDESVKDYSDFTKWGEKINKNDENIYRKW